MATVVFYCHRIVYHINIALITNSLSKLRVFILTRHKFILIQNVPLHVRHMFQPVLRPLDMPIQKPYKGGGPNCRPKRVARM
jgi:hypothetical protein